jgi:alpha-D-ribose 1-methylphosphonate 5-triphosphate synthase subunit PhnG
LQDVEDVMAEADPNDRKDWISTLAKAPPSELRRLFAELPSHDLLRPAEVGAVMVRGRVGGTGAPFNLGEMSVTRCSVRLEDGTVGHAWVQGRDKDHARRAALVDALMQTDAAQDLRQSVIVPLAAVARQSREARAEKAAGTKVDFFTMVRGEDQ